MITFVELAERMKVEILDDVRNGIVPNTVGSFAELHDYVDANCYGGTEALLDELDDAAPDNDEGHRAALDTLCDLSNTATALGFRYSLNQLFADVLSENERRRIEKDLATIEYWRGVYAQYKGREHELLENEPTLIDVVETSNNGRLIRDGFHRVAAAKLEGLRTIGARLTSNFNL